LYVSASSAKKPWDGRRLLDELTRQQPIAVGGLTNLLFRPSRTTHFAQRFDRDQRER
jgi:hypothetical protein